MDYEKVIITFMIKLLKSGPQDRVGFSRRTVIGPMSKRVHKFVSYKDDTSSDDDNDDYREVGKSGMSAKSSSKSKKKALRGKEKFAKATFGEKPTKSKHGKSKPKKRSSSGPLSVHDAPKRFADISPDDLHHDPAGNPCRFVPFEQIQGKILQPELFLEPGESGVLTFLPDFVAGDPKHLEYFGFDSGVVKTELSTIAKMTDAELEAELQAINDELERLPKLKNSPNVLVPGFSTALEDSIAINADVRTFDWKRLGNIQKFDVITMDPPWQIAVANVTRGVNISYEQLEVGVIGAIPLHYVQDNGYLFMWVIASQLANGVMMLQNWGYKLETYMNWVKISKCGRYMPSHGYYMQHTKESLLVGLKGRPPAEMNKELFDTLIVRQRGVRQSHKPEELYEMIEQIFPAQMYLEVFARPHNLRTGWVSLGIELPT
jgi:N6-adenosine-specific RNA methylase IME4